jgi:hypothetical protein
MLQRRGATIERIDENLTESAKLHRETDGAIKLIQQERTLISRESSA